MKLAVKVAQQVPVAIAAVGCVVELGEEIVRGVLAGPDDLETEESPLVRQVAKIADAVRKLKKAVWPFFGGFDHDEDFADYEDVVDVPPFLGNIIPFDPGGGEGGATPCS